MRNDGLTRSPHRSGALRSVATAAVVLAVAAIAPRVAHAATIAVTSTSQEMPFVANGNCTLGEAIVAANLDQKVDGCAVGAGADTLQLQSNATYALDQPDDINNGYAFRAISSPLTIEGNGATIIRNAGAPDFGIFKINAPGQGVQFVALTITGGRSARAGGGIQGGIGGGIFNADGATTLEHCAVRGNAAVAGTSAGGGIMNLATLTLRNTRVTDNRSANGAGVYNLGGTVTIADSTVDGNTADMAGGGIFVDGGNATLRNCTIANNVAQGGGGIGLSQQAILGGKTIPSAATITNCTIAGNQATTGYAGGLFAMVGARLQNAILGANIAPPGHHSDCAGAMTSLGNNLIGDATGCQLMTASPLPEGSQPDIVNVPPLLDVFRADAAVNRGGYYPLRDKSAAINAGNPNVCVGELAADQLGSARVGPCDIGAIEADCGDGIVQAALGEECDDGNVADDDGCSGGCAIEKAMREVAPPKGETVPVSGAGEAGGAEGSAAGTAAGAGTGADTGSEAARGASVGGGGAGCTLIR